MKQGGNDPDGVCAATEAKKKDAVAGFEIVHQEYVRVADIGLQPVSDRFSEESCDPFREPSQRAWRFHGAKTGMVKGDLLGTMFQRMEQLHYVSAVLRKFVRRAVAA